jgi:homoserine O-acetyltransferase/O-succinyltransferase
VLRRLRSLFFTLAILVAIPLAAQEEFEQRIASIGDFRLDSGDVIRDCRIGYRTAGKLNEAKSNAILVPTWFAGRSADLKGWIGAGNFLDPARYYIVVIDALGDGVSSSPSNSQQRPFPRFTLRDMVRSEHELLTRELKLPKLHAVAGLSMGGMQALYWAVTFPDAMTRVVALSASTKHTPADQMLWKTQLDLLEGAADPKKAMRIVAGINSLELSTPARLNTVVKDGVAELDRREKALAHLDPHDYIAQLYAMLAHDIARDFDGSMEKAAQAVKVPLMIGVALQDQMVNPAPAREFAKLANAEIFTLSGDCGHGAFGCERDVVNREVARFLAAP